MPWEVDGKYREIGEICHISPLKSNKQDLFAEFTSPSGNQLVS